MFLLQRNEDILNTAARCSEVIDYALERLADSSEGLSFEKEAHLYFLGGQQMRSVSSIVEHFAPFDTEGKAMKAATNPKHPLYGKSVEEIIAIWNKKRDDAADAGTLVHEFGEGCCDYLLGKESLLSEEVLGMVTPEGLAVDEPGKRAAAARWWAENDWKRYCVVAKETRIVNPFLRYAGTFDLLLYDTLTDTFCVRDYKTNEDLYKWFGDYMVPPLNMLRANDIGKYTVQQTLYSIQLRNIGLQISSNQLVWLKEDGTYECVELPLNYDRVIAFAVNNIKTN